MFSVAFLTACIFGALRGDIHAPLRLALLVETAGIAVATYRYAYERSPRYLLALGILGLLLVTSGLLLITDRP